MRRKQKSTRAECRQTRIRELKKEDSVTKKAHGNLFLQRGKSVWFSMQQRCHSFSSIARCNICTEGHFKWNPFQNRCAILVLLFLIEASPFSFRHQKFEAFPQGAWISGSIDGNTRAAWQKSSPNKTQLSLFVGPRFCAQKRFGAGGAINVACTQQIWVH